MIISYYLKIPNTSSLTFYRASLNVSLDDYETLKQLNSLFNKSFASILKRGRDNDKQEFNNLGKAIK